MSKVPHAATLAFGVPLVFTIALLLWREQENFDESLKAPPSATAVPTRVPIQVPAPRDESSGPGSRQSNDIVGRARVVDGDTIELASTKVRLNGIDAPETTQVCGTAHVYRCGDRASEALKDLLNGKITVCRPSGRDLYGRIVATCFLGEVDVNRWLVAMGYAVAFRRYSTVYVAAELSAQAAGRGLWASGFEMPWDYRTRIRGQRQASTPE